MHHDDTASGDRTAASAWFVGLVREHYAPALRYAARLLRDAAEAEDCVQEAFAEAFQSRSGPRQPEAAPAWLRSIVRHRCLRRMRRRDLHLLPFAAEVDELPQASLDADDERRQRAALAQLIVRALPPHERELVLLFYVKECSQREIASFLGLPPSTVNNRLHDARRRMKEWEKHMDMSRVDSAFEDRVCRIGTIVSVRGPWIEARFEPDAPCDLFDALAVMDVNGQCVERLKVAQRTRAGRLVCLPTGKDSGPLAVGTSVLNTGKVGLELTRLRGAHGVSAADLDAAAAALRGGGGERGFLPTGIKAIDLLCPLPARGVAAQAGTAGVGRMVLLDELAQRLAPTGAALELLCLAERTEPDLYRDLDDGALWSQGASTSFYWALSAQGTDPTCSALDVCDAAMYLSPLLAVHGWYPAIDPEHSRSKLLAPQLVGHEHCELAARAREELLLLKRASADPVLLELLASRARAAAHRRARSHTPELAGAEGLRLARARKLQLFLTQPFGVVSDWTGWDGVTVSVEDTLLGVRAILDGRVDDLPEGAFAYAGTLDDVRRHARDGVARHYGE